MTLNNCTKIQFCNAFFELKTHTASCRECAVYTEFGDGDLCETGKQIILMEMMYADTHPLFPDFPGDLLKEESCNP